MRRGPCNAIETCAPAALMLWWGASKALEKQVFCPIFEWFASISLKKGAQIKSYLISHALITAGFKMWKQIHLYTHQVSRPRILYSKCLNLYLLFLKIYLMDYRIKSFIKARRCVETARRRCVFKIYNVTRLKIFAPQTALNGPYLM